MLTRRESRPNSQILSHSNRLGENRVENQNFSCSADCLGAHLAAVFEEEHRHHGFNNRVKPFRLSGQGRSEPSSPWAGASSDDEARDIARGLFE